MKVVNRFRNKRSSAREAKERLRRVLPLDRAQVSPGKLRYIEQEFAQAVRKHLGIDPENVEVQISGRGRDMQLSARASLRRTAA